MPILSSNQPTFWWDRVPDDRAAEWDALVAGRSVYMGSQYLRAMEDHPKVKTRLAVWTSEGTGSGALPDRLAGVAVFQRVSIESRSPDGHLDLGWIMRLVNRVLHPGGKPFTFSAWVAGQSLGSGPHAHVFEAGLSAVDAALRIDAAFRALARIDKLCSDLSASAWILKDQLSGADLKLSNLQRRGWAQLAFDPVMVLPLKQDWHGIEDWMDALRTKARTKVKAILQRSSQVELVPLDAAQAEAMTDVLYGLYCAVYGRAGLVMGGLAPEDFARLKREHGDDFCLVAHSYEGRWVGFHCGFCTAETPTGERSIEAYFVGFEPSFNKKLGLYQRMLVEFVRWGIQRDASRVIMGRTALEIKSGIGALPVPLTLSVRFRNPVLRALMVLGAGLFVPKPFVPRRAWRENAALDWAERGAESGYQEKGLSA